MITQPYLFNTSYQTIYESPYPPVAILVEYEDSDEAYIDEEWDASVIVPTSPAGQA
jgi:hypothetical protein